jgi:hypothetical protein
VEGSNFSLMRPSIIACELMESVYFSRNHQSYFFPRIADSDLSKNGDDLHIVSISWSHAVHSTHVLDVGV